jgi:glyoxylase-like metal-dependent hydrolase (beta-lactamase superfamily II)
MRPFGLPRQDGSGGAFQRGYGVVHCLLLETGDGLALVDTGWGLRDCMQPTPAVRQFANVVQSSLDPAETAVAQVQRLGYSASDVKDIFLTHLHMDHAGGLPDFPRAAIHASAEEVHAFQHPRTLTEWRAYRPEHGAHRPRWQAHDAHASRWFGLQASLPIKVGRLQIVLVPLTGHTRGHCAVAVQVGEEWLLHCGDAYAYYRQADPQQPYVHPCGPWIEWAVATGFGIQRRHWQVLRDLRRSHPDTVAAFCSHDAHEFAQAQRRK